MSAHFHEALGSAGQSGWNMVTCWTVPVVAVALLGCIFGFEIERNPSYPQIYPANPDLSQGGYQWNQPQTQPAQTSHTQGHHQSNPPVIRPAQFGYQWNKPVPQPADPSTSQSGNQWTRLKYQPANPLPSQSGNQWTSQANQPANPSTSQSGYPKIPQWPQTPMDPSVLSCDVAAEVHVPCGPSGITAEGCHAINCCFDGHSCYFGKAVTVQCTKDGQFIVVVSRDATIPTIDLALTSLLESGQGCSYVDSNSQFAIYQFPVTKCGSYVMEDSDAIVYENRLSCYYEVALGPYGAITRDSQFDLLFQCKYSSSSVETMLVEVVKMDNPFYPVAAQGPINVQLRLANGKCQTKGCNEVAAAYTSYYMDTDYPVTKVLRDPVYVQVQLMDRTDPLLVLTLGRCWVTNSPNPHSLPQWTILIDGCPCRNDRYLSTVVPIGSNSGLDYPTHYKRFFFKMFTFVDLNTLSPQSQQIYIHCSTDVCDTRQGHSCDPSCYRQRRDVDAVLKDNVGPKAVSSVGPILIIKSE